MDFVDEVRGKFSSLEELAELPEQDRMLLRDISARYPEHNLLFMAIDRGLSQAKKFVVKPASLYPFLVKLGPTDEILAELQGYELLRLRVPPTNLPQFESMVQIGDRAALIYRYVTGGLISHPVGRLDVFIGSGYPQQAVTVVREIYDVVMKKCHWADGEVVLAPLTLPTLEAPDENVDLDLWDEITSRYRVYAERSRDCRAPIGIVHGDLHPKNVLITRTHEPVLIDFSMTSAERCVYIDYAKLEAQLQFQVSPEVGAEFWHISDRVYLSGQLILPRSNRELASCIMAIRSTLWKICLSDTVGLEPEEIDRGYGGFLLYHLVRFWSKAGNSAPARERALGEIQSLAPNL